MKTYAEKLKDPRWQKKRLQVLEAAGWECVNCGSGTKTLHVHHGYYMRGREPWDYPDTALHCLCEDCHKRTTETRSAIDALLGSQLLGEETFTLGVLVGVFMQQEPDLEFSMFDHELARGAGLVWGLSAESLLHLEDVVGIGKLCGREIETFITWSKNNAEGKPPS